MKKVLAIASMVLAAGLMITGCSKKSKTVEVEIWHTYTGAQLECLTKIAESFNASQSDYEVKVMDQDYSGFAAHVYNAVANGIGPNVIFNYGSTATDYVDAGLALDIKPFIEADIEKGDVSFQKIIDSLPEASKTEVYGFADGGIHYLPGATTGPVFFYNKTLYDELELDPPESWNDLADNCYWVYEEKGIPGFYADGLVDVLQSMIMQADLGYIDTKNKKVTFCKDELLSIFYWYSENCNEGYFEFNTVGKYASDDLSNGTIAAFSGSCVNDQYINFANGDELGIAPMIAVDGLKPFYTAWNRGPVMFKKSEAADKGTYEFIKFFLQPENNAEWAKANSAVAPYGTTQETAAYKEYINNLPENSALLCVQENMKYAGSFPNVTGSSEIRNLLVQYLNYVVDGQMDIEEAVERLEEECNAALNK